jgi:transcriptional regulator with XRE-family HTH domain
MEKKSFKKLFEEAEKHEDYWISKLILNFTEELYRAMKAKEINKAQLAKKVGTSAAYITKVLRGDANFTLKTMCRLAKAVGENLQIGLVPQKVQPPLVRDVSRSAGVSPTTVPVGSTYHGWGYSRRASNQIGPDWTITGSIYSVNWTTDRRPCTAGNSVGPTDPRFMTASNSRENNIVGVMMGGGH